MINKEEITEHLIQKGFTPITILGMSHVEPKGIFQKSSDYEGIYYFKPVDDKGIGTTIGINLKDGWCEMNYLDNINECNMWDCWGRTPSFKGYIKDLEVFKIILDIILEKE